MISTNGVPPIPPRLHAEYPSSSRGPGAILYMIFFSRRRSLNIGHMELLRIVFFHSVSLKFPQPASRYGTPSQGAGTAFPSPRRELAGMPAAALRVMGAVPGVQFWNIVTVSHRRSTLKPRASMRLHRFTILGEGVAQFKMVTQFLGSQLEPKQPPLGDDTPAPKSCGMCHHRRP